MAPTRLDIAKPDIIRFFESSALKVYSAHQVSRILQDNRAFWRAAQSTTTPRFIQFLLDKTLLRKITLTSDHGYRALTRYVWKDASPLQVALSLRANQYLCHGTAAYSLGLSQQPLRAIFVNREQTVKPRPSSPPTPDSIAMAYSRPARYSRLTYQYGESLIVLVAGKFTNNLGVVPLQLDGSTLMATGLERTLVDIVVRPEYAGGPTSVLDAYRAAKDRASVSKLISTLRQLDYVYPYHQAIGFYMTKAGYPRQRVSRLRQLGLDFDFYLCHNIKKPVYDKEWRLNIPQGL